MAQRVRADRDPEKNPGRTSSSPLLLAGLLKCGKCGAAYQLQTSGKRSPTNENGYRYYNCRSALRIGKEKCSGGAIPTALLEQAVLEHIADRIFTEERCKALLHDLVEESGVLRQKTSEQRQQLQRELEDVERRIKRWQEGFETGTVTAELGGERVRELRARREELMSTLSKVVPLRPPPAHLYSQVSISRFQRSLRELFLSDDPALTRNYLRFLVEEIVVTGDQIDLVARTAAAIQMMAAAGSGPAPIAGHKSTEAGVCNHPPQVRTTVVDWLQLLDSNQRPGG
ncbi:recombinase zinc beta ribbon domain-containing protein [Polyangium jinanense]|nr:recombinase zinc beta ribbon domain-containing protein [Polyangium jinanense]